MNYLEHLTENKNIFFNFMKKRYPIFHQSNLFLRDMQYAIMSYFELKENSLSYEEAEKIAKGFIDKLVNSGELLELDHKTWKVNFEVEQDNKVVENETVVEGVGNE